jgi:uncharacterized membrane protein YeaQ/YmgE (transglycosylase-associated protein family)
MQTVANLIVWIIVGALAGPLAGMVLTRTKVGFGRWKNLGFGLAGALIGGFLCNQLGFTFGVSKIQVGADKLVGAFLGCLLLAVGFWGYRFWKRKRAAGPSS